MTWEGGRAGINKNVTDAGSQMTWEGGKAGINKNVTNAGSQLTFQMFGFVVYVVCHHHQFLLFPLNGHLDHHDQNTNTTIGHFNCSALSASNVGLLLEISSPTYFNMILYYQVCT